VTLSLQKGPKKITLMVCIVDKITQARKLNGLKDSMAKLLMEMKKFATTTEKERLQIDKVIHSSNHAAPSASAKKRKTTATTAAKKKTTRPGKRLKMVASPHKKAPKLPPYSAEMIAAISESD